MDSSDQKTDAAKQANPVISLFSNNMFSKALPSSLEPEEPAAETGSDGNEEKKEEENSTPLIQFSTNPFSMGPFDNLQKANATAPLKQQVARLEELSSDLKTEVTEPSLVPPSLLAFNNLSAGQASSSTLSAPHTMGALFSELPKNSLILAPPQLSPMTGALGSGLAGREQLRGMQYHTYHSVDTLAPQVEQDLDLSIDIDLCTDKKFSSHQLVKLFQSTPIKNQPAGNSNILAFLTSHNNITLLLNQQELCESVISPDVLSQLSASSFDDFTLVQGRYLLVLLTKAQQQQLVVFDCEQVSNRQSNQVRYLQTIDIFMDKKVLEEEESEQDFTFKRVQALGDSLPKSVLLVGKYGTVHGPCPLMVQFTTYECERQVELTETPFATEKNEAAQAKPIQIIDVCVWENKVAFLYDYKNFFAVYDLTTLSLVFKSSFEDASDQITGFYHIPAKSESNLGFFALLETKTQTKKRESLLTSKKVMKKVHLVELQQKEIKTSRKNMVSQKIDRFEQIDALSFGTESQKMSDFCFTGNNEFYLFLLNKRVSVSKKQLRLFTVKINASKSKKKSKVYFDYITESVPKLNQTNIAVDQKPAYFKVMPMLNEGVLDFFAYLGLRGAGHSAVFKFAAGEISGPPIEEEESPESEEQEIPDEQIEPKQELQDRKKQNKVIASPEPVKTDAQQVQPMTPSPGLKELEDILQNDFNQMKAQVEQKQAEPQKKPENKQKKQTKQQQQQQKQQHQQQQQEEPTPVPQLIYKEKGASPQANVSPSAEKPRKQEQLLLENFADLQSKYADLHGRLNQLTQQIKTQKDLQIQVEQTVTRAVKASMPEMIKKQVEDTVTPLIAKQADVLNAQISGTINNVLLPRIEQQIRTMFVAGEQQTIPAPTQQPESQNQVPTVHGLNGEQVRKIVHQEFREAMSQQIVPELEKSLKTTLMQIRDPLNAMNKALFEQLVSAETRSDYFVRRLDQQLSQQVLNLNHLQHQQQSYQQQQFQQQQVQVQAQHTYPFSSFNNSNTQLPHQQQQPPIQYFNQQSQQQQQQPITQNVFQPGNSAVGIFYPNQQTQNTQQPTAPVFNIQGAPQQHQQTQLKFQPTTQTVNSFQLNAQGAQNSSTTGQQPQDLVASTVVAADPVFTVTENKNEVKKAEEFDDEQK